MFTDRIFFLKRTFFLLRKMFFWKLIPGTLVIGSFFFGENWIKFVWNRAFSDGIPSQEIQTREAFSFQGGQICCLPIQIFFSSGGFLLYHAEPTGPCPRWRHCWGELLLNRSFWKTFQTLSSVMVPFFPFPALILGCAMYRGWAWYILFFLGGEGEGD